MSLAQGVIQSNDWTFQSICSALSSKSGVNLKLERDGVIHKLDVESAVYKTLDARPRFSNAGANERCLTALSPAFSGMCTYV